jgi:hypothetical protein
MASAIQRFSQLTLLLLPFKNEAVACVSLRSFG